MMTHLWDIPDDDEDEPDSRDDSSDEVGLNKEQVESAEEEESVEEEVEVTDNPTISAADILIPELDLTMFITDNFCCNLCLAPVGVRNLQSGIVGCASNLFWKCSSPTCDASAKILAKQSSKEVSGTTRRYRPDVAASLGDYDINRQIVLACQQSSGGSRMASTFAGLMSLSNRSVWNNHFTEVEILIGKAQIRLGNFFIKQNLQNEIAVSPMDLTLNRAKVTLMMDGGWDQRASRKAYNSSSGRLVSVGPRTNKVCGLVYYSKR
jgi:hypothetical protein